tara:strand:+ start:379 stop:804 length:426 start_codon:yes stop_codon:yes gene_type:complete
MKHLQAKNKFENYETVTMDMKDLVPASIYETVPDRDKLYDGIKDGDLQYPLLVYQADKEYWTKNHLPLYKSNSPGLPDMPPILDTKVVRSGHEYVEPKIHIIWSGRQRFQLAQELGYTHVDCILESNFFTMVNKAGKFRKL